MDFISLVTKYSTQIYAHGANPQLQKAFLDSLSPGQIYSKLKAIEVLEQHKLKFDRALFIGQWHGLLPHMMHESGLINSAVGIELSETWSSISHHVNKGWNWTSTQGNINDPEVWRDQRPELVVNTSSEHMSFEWMQFVPDDTVVLLQSSNYQILEHCNTVNSLNELIEKSKLSKVIESKEQDFEVYKRFTVLGKK